jgi:hypothetical protein
MKTNKGLTALTVDAEREEIGIVYHVCKRNKCDHKGQCTCSECGHMPIKLQYLKKSKQMMGQPFWNVLSPVPGYKSGGINGYPTFGLQTLKDKGLI